MTPTLAQWLHDLSPWVVRLPGTGIGVRWYGLSYIAGFAAAWLLVRWMGKRRMTPIPSWAALDAIMWAALGAIVGGRLLYCVLYQPSLLWTLEPSFPFWGGLMINRGGMASHGGMLGVYIAAWRISRGFRVESGGAATKEAGVEASRTTNPSEADRASDGEDRAGVVVGRCPPLHVMEVLAAASGPGLLFGRLANFINGELLGRVVASAGEPGPSWSVRYPQEHLTGHVNRTPEAQRALDELVLTYAPAAPGFATGYELLLEKLQAGGTNAALIAERLAPMVSARHPTQLYQGLAEGIAPTVVVCLLWARPRALGVVGGAWLITYGGLRVVTELVRLPDDHLRVAQIAGLSRGQWLSVGMIVLGVALIAFGRKLSSERFGGWRQPAGA
ncbi:MAG: prolipoprotein diacylglyceryl transferase [Planctomycetota bacterium]